MTTRAQWLAAEPFDLALSAGFFGFFSHAGLLAALEARALLPRRVVGVSAGALAGGLWASGWSAAELADELASLRRRDFWDPGLPLGGLLRGRKFMRKLGELLAATGSHQFSQCRIPFAAVVHDVLARRSVVMDDGRLDVAIVASCTVPGMFRPVLHKGRVLVDGGVSDRCGRTALPKGGRTLLHFLPSRRRWGSAEAAPQDIGGGPSLVVVTPGLPRVTPFRLPQGPRALALTREHAEAWLDAPVEASP